MSHADLTRFAQLEFNTAAVELTKLSPQEAQIRCYGRLDEAMRQATLSATVSVACRAGCSYCCHYKIEAKPVEVLALKQYVVNHLKPEQIKLIMAQAKHNIKEAKGLSHSEQLLINQRCAFLLDNQCSVYPARPSNCRIYHAVEVEPCQQAFEEPTSNATPSMIGNLKDAGGGTAEGFEQATRAQGIDTRLYDLSTAFVEAMQNPTVAKRLKSGKKTFVTAKVIE